MIFRAIIVAASCLAFANCSSGHDRRLSQSDGEACQEGGGFEGRTPFGHPICQGRYPDGGKACKSDIDCTGKCLSEDLPETRVGAPIAGQCETFHQTFGCYGTVENGVLATPYICAE